MTLRESIEAGQRGSFVTRLYEAYCKLREAGNMVSRAYQVADLENRRKMNVSFPISICGAKIEDDDWDYGFLARRLEEQYPVLLQLDDETDNPHQFQF